jgi:uncharacterized protein
VTPTDPPTSAVARPAGSADPRPPKPRPTAIADADTAPYLSAALENRLLVQRCDSCAEHQLYGRALCKFCGGTVSWVDASGRGTVASWTVIRQNHSRPWRDMLPYVVALVDLEEGPRLMTNIVGCDLEDLSIGMRVRARFERVSDEAAIALFEPAG